MERDLDLAVMVDDGRYDVTFRTYTWDPWTVSLGRHQPPSSINDRLIREQGFGIVQRPTGGRAVFHAEELTYALAVRSDHPKDVYRLTHELLLRALGTIVPGQLDHTSKPMDLREHYASSGSLGSVCFTANAPTEIMAEGRKVVGSAQRILDNGVILQHGSILIGTAHEKIAAFIGRDGREVLRVQEALRRSAVSLSELTGSTLTPTDVATAVHHVVTAERLRNLL